MLENDKKIVLHSEYRGSAYAMTLRYDVVPLVSMAIERPALNLIKSKLVDFQ